MARLRDRPGVRWNRSLALAAGNDRDGYSPDRPMPLPPALLDALPLLACPRCGGALVARDAGAECSACSASWPVVDGVLDFLAESCEDVADPEDPSGR
jgi:uncharacterized protein YbaR (Trm112 family)